MESSKVTIRGEGKNDDALLTVRQNLGQDNSWPHEDERGNVNEAAVRGVHLQSGKDRARNGECGSQQACRHGEIARRKQHVPRERLRAIIQ